MKKLPFQRLSACGRGRGRQQEGEEHPDVYKPWTQPAKHPAAAQREHQRWEQRYEGGEQQSCQAVPGEIVTVEYGGLGEDSQSQQGGAGQRGGAACQRV